ncbi:MAG: DUF975 family protein [Clostridiales Family XIII bacterium]|jgi:uncharacterized membrane protein|nr:DUF975 family protein [Clostridiales Family XIII bacterium]
MHYQQLIITEPASNFRALARQGVKGRWGDAFLKGLVYMLILNLPILLIYAFTVAPDMSESMNELMSGAISYEEYTEMVTDGDALDQALPSAYSNAYSSLSPLSWVYSLLIGGALMFGITSVYLRYRRRQEAPTELLFVGFSNFSRAIALYLIMSIFIALWTLLFIIPGIIASYRYRLAFYILIDNPGMGPLEAINMSKALMNGNKWKLFCLDLSFIGWGILATFITAIVSTPFAMSMTLGANAMDMSGLPLYTIIAGVIACVAFGLLYVYNGTAVAAFYERASGILKYRDEIN